MNIEWYDEREALLIVAEWLKEHAYNSEVALESIMRLLEKPWQFQVEYQVAMRDLERNG